MKVSASKNCSIVLLCVFFCFVLVNSISEVELKKQGYNFAAIVAINSTDYQEVVDTGSYRLITYTYNYSSPALWNETQWCSSFTLDGTSLAFQGDKVRYPCQFVNEDIQLGTAEAFGPLLEAPYLYIENPNLHKWYDGNGVLGMTYCQISSSNNCTSPTTFQQLLLNTSADSTGVTEFGGNFSSLVFGLDFRTSDGDGKYTAPNSYGINGSALQMGYVDPQFASNIVWTQQPTVQPDYHNFFLNNLEFCDAQILGNYSTNWNVLVDTGSVCLSLPGEIYENFHAWFGGNGSVIENVNALPAFSFQVGQDANTTTLYIPLADLLVDESAIKTEYGAPYVYVRNSQGGLEAKRLCVIATNAVEDSDGSHANPAPEIIFGSLAIQSMYFAADFGQYSVGLANKLSASYIAGFGPGNRVGCAERAGCVGDQSFDYSSNTCTNPKCSRYFFTVLNEDSMSCDSNFSNMVGGLVFIALIALAEVVSYFVTQYSAHVALDVGREASIDPITKYIGMQLCVIIDLVIVHLLGWAPRRNATRAVAASNGNGARQF